MDKKCRTTDEEIQKLVADHTKELKQVCEDYWSGKKSGAGNMNKYMSPDELYEDWYGKYKTSKGDAAYYAIVELMGFLRDLRHSDELPCINGQHVITVEELLFTFKSTLVGRLSGDEDYF